eukprot:TRINITY_DN2527_c0_g2_i2.p2 TRINITY_DN2527_c0_g2~~TRINITY_DN2527_c0_g2_i2.p2  ORF type:complete len:142 (+),score=26.64 TRINITY_DN2527_c0_g2_i2:58-483(+)
MMRRPPRSTQGVSSAASDVYKRQVSTQSTWVYFFLKIKNLVPKLDVLSSSQSFLTKENTVSIMAQQDFQKSKSSLSYSLYICFTLLQKMMIFMQLIWQQNEGENENFSSVWLELLYSSSYPFITIDYLIGSKKRENQKRIY